MHWKTGVCVCVYMVPCSCVYDFANKDIQYIYRHINNSKNNNINRNNNNTNKPRETSMLPRRLSPPRPKGLSV